MTRSRRSRKGGVPATWCWRRWIASGRAEEWLERLRAGGVAAWALTGKPEGARSLITVYVRTRGEAWRLTRAWGGRARLLRASEWIAPPSVPLQIGPGLRIVHEKTRGRAKKSCPELHIPHGLAFGSGEHATTSMLLRALMRAPDLSGSAVLDLGTGSGVLALAARRRGARKIVATDWDAEAIRTARENELLNFREASIRWRKADVRRLRAKGGYDLVLANLFSGILCEAAGAISEAVAPEGELWLSGILRAQEAQVWGAFRGGELRLARSVRRGKWVMLQWAR